MEANFWHSRWEKREIGFHQETINPFLEKYWSTLELARESTVFVPLCGKSKDMLWLAQQGHHVLGVEISETAVQEFFDEADVQPKCVQKGSFSCYSANNIELWVGDFFAITAQALQGIAAVYDRAALVALPSEMRRDYVNQLAETLPTTSQTLLVTFEYGAEAKKGPPFSIDCAEVTKQFSDTCIVNLLESQPFDFRGVDAIEHTFRLEYF